MEVKSNRSYVFSDSLSRIQAFLDGSGVYPETNDIQKRQNLTYENGYYVDCYALFVDIRDSSKLPQIHQKRVLAKLYRSYISELTAIMQSYPNCKEINIVGDCVNGIFSCYSKDDVLQPFGAAYTINGIVQILNLKANEKGYNSIRIGIGIAKGKALMVQAGYKGSGINDVIWMGDVVNCASHLCAKANKSFDDIMNISQEVYNDLEGKLGYQNKPYQGMFKKSYGNDYYTGNVILHTMDEWIKEKTKRW